MIATTVKHNCYQIVKSTYKLVYFNFLDMLFYIGILMSVFTGIWIAEAMLKILYDCYLPISFLLPEVCF
ncbi:hypothetical protein GLYMA_09G173600v4 [Glycine max]|uniref:Uncharacterized protein n=1 Tax=Glycine max TaxID=3847 RepID=A0A0R0I9P1_SOYBN|nr:hypothetical protein GYH30_025341 [Glycine max]KRH39038.1 hypothetical protein GLYMA_09G173600v4 [Glycine max]